MILRSWLKQVIQMTHHIVDIQKLFFVTKFRFFISICCQKNIEFAKVDLKNQFRE